MLELCNHHSINSIWAHADNMWVHVDWHLCGVMFETTLDLEGGGRSVGYILIETNNA